MENFTRVGAKHFAKYWRAADASKFAAFSRRDGFFESFGNCRANRRKMLDKACILWYFSIRVLLESWPSGLRRRSWKPVFPKGTVGSNPTFSVSVLRRHKLNITRVVRSSYRLRPKLFPLHGEVPKRLKGHPWKGCRSLIAARGFKSLLLRERKFPNEELF